MTAATRKRKSAAPEKGRPLKIAVMPSPGPVDCPCGRKVVWAYDDRFVNDPREIGTMVDAEPRIDGTCVLYYEVTAKDEPRGKQWLRELDPKALWDGQRWRRHICGEVLPGGAA
jgi:hypothetical protein